MGSIVAFLIAQGWASGISTWGVLVATGVADEAGWVDAPGALGSPALLAVASVFLVIEVVADKVAYVDSVSDAIQTLIRPVAGAAIAAEWGSADEQISTELAAVIGGGSATVSHFAKMGLRGALNLSPEPFSNVAISSTEDVAGLTVITLAFSYPWLALAVVLPLLALTIVAIVVAVHLYRRAAERIATLGAKPRAG